MLQHFQNLMLSVFIFFILQHFFYCYSLTVRFVDSEIHNSKGPFPGHSLNFVLVWRYVWFCFVLALIRDDFYSLLSQAMMRNTRQSSWLLESWWDVVQTSVLHGWGLVLPRYLIRLCPHVIMHRIHLAALLRNFKILALGCRLFRDKLRVDVDKLRLGRYFFRLFDLWAWQFEGCRVVHLGDHSSVDLLRGAALLISRLQLACLHNEY